MKINIHYVHVIKLSIQKTTLKHKKLEFKNFKRTVNLKTGINLLNNTVNTKFLIEIELTSFQIETHESFLNFELMH